MEPWTRSYFDTVYLHRWTLGLPGPEERGQVEFLLGRLSAGPGDRLLDVGCGQGRYSLSFAQRALRVTGLDDSPSLLREARRLTESAGAEVRWVRGDMRALPSPAATTSRSFSTPSGSLIPRRKTKRSFMNWRA